jgi:hypothetical protein
MLPLAPKTYSIKFSKMPFESFGQETYESPQFAAILHKTGNPGYTVYNTAGQQYQHTTDL